jgi:predicted transcriptional regulator
LASNLPATTVTWSDELERRLAPLAEDGERYRSRRAELPWN